MTYYKVINRETRNAQIFSQEEMQNFFYSGLEKGKKPLNDWKDYAVSTTESPQDKEILKFINTIAISLFSVACVILISNFITNLF